MVLSKDPLSKFVYLNFYTTQKHGAENQVRKNLVLELWSKIPKFRHFSPVFQMQISWKQKEKRELLMNFHRVEKMVLSECHVKFVPLPFLHPENQGQKLCPKKDLIYIFGFFSKTASRIFLIFWMQLVNGGNIFVTVKVKLSGKNLVFPKFWKSAEIGANFHYLKKGWIFCKMW